MSRHRDFDAARAEHQGEPLTFRLAGRDFTVPFVAALPMLDVGSAVVGGNLDIAAAFAKFLFDAVPEDQHDELREAFNEVQLAVVVDLATWLIEETVNRPLDKPSASSGGPSPNGTESRLEPVGWTPSP